MSERIPMARQARARLMAPALVGVGVLLVVSTVLVALTGASLDVLAALVLLVLLVVFGLATLLARPVLTLDEHGYRVRLVRGAGVRSAAWSQVVDLQTRDVAGARCVVLGLRDGTTTTVPVDLLEGDPEALVGRLTERLDAGHGYRRVDVPDPGGD